MSETDDEVRLASVKGARKTLMFALPSILMMVLTSSYVMADGLMISNLINTDAFAGVNIAMPMYSVITALGFMFATGGSALVSKKLGEGKLKEANADFSFIVLFATVLGLVLTALCLIFMGPLVTLIGADDTLRPYTEEYLRIIAFGAAFFMLQFIANQFMVVSGKPALSLAFAIIAGIVNIVLDYILIAVFGMGVSGAAIASAMSAVLPCAVALVLFLSKKNQIHFTRPSMDFPALGKACYNGMSEMVSELSLAVSTLAFNLTMMQYIGPDGVSAITIISYINFLSLAVVIGYSTGVAPVMGYHYGNKDSGSMSALYRTSVLFTLSFSVFVFICMELLGGFVVQMFDTGNMNLREVATYGIRIHAFAFLAMGINIYMSSLFTSLSDGTRSAVIALLRGLVVLLPMILILPAVMGINGIWLAMPITEAVVFVVCLCMIRKQSHRYGIVPLLHRKTTA